MKASTVIAVAVGFTASLVSAQLGAIPSCALGCAVSALPTSCGATDIHCICANTGFVDSLIPCAEKACSASDLEAAAAAAETLCLSASVTLSIPPLTSSAAAATTTAPPTTTAAAITYSSSSSTTAVPTTSPSSTAAPATTTVVVATNSTGNGTSVISSSPTPSQTGAAARNGVAGFAAILAFAAAFL